jgi:hypothetical protein
VGRHAVEIVCRKDDPDAVCVQVGEEVEDLVPGADVDTRSGFVEEDDSRSTDQCPSEEHPLLLAPGQFPDVPVGQLCDAQSLENRLNLCLLGATRPRQGAPRSTAHKDALGHGHREVPVDRLQLGHIADGQIHCPGDCAGYLLDGA